MASKPESTIRKLLACELQVLTYNDEKKCFELKIEGQTFDTRLIWIQGYLTQNADELAKPEMESILGDSSPSDIWLFRDQSASSIPVVLPLELRQQLEGAVDESFYYSMVVTVAPPDETLVPRGGKIGTNVKLRAKRLINLNHEMFDEEARKKYNEMVEEVWCYEVVQYHRMICDSL